MAKKNNVSRKERQKYHELDKIQVQAWKDLAERLRTRLRELWPTGDYRNDVVLHPVLLQIVCNFYGFVYKDGLFWCKDKNRNDICTHTYVGEHLDHFVSYYILDDGETEILNNEIRIARDDGNCQRKTVAAEWILENLKDSVTVS